MFYSHTFLARKSPLGTMWIAAHLERKIKKPQIDVIDIPSYADCIMFPEVPIALRLSGHLLLGLVRIYSWKVNYLFQDCNRMLTDIRTIFASVQVDLPVDADRAPFESVTLPYTFELDALELDDSVYQTDGPDNHLKTYDQITMQDQIQIEGEPYVAFFIDEDNRSDMSPHPELSNRGAVPMEEDVLPSFEGELDALATPLGNALGFNDPGPSNLAEGSVQSLNEVHIPQEFPEIEVMRDAVNNFEPGSLPEWSDTINDIGGLHEQSGPSMSRKASLSPIMEGLSVSGGVSLPSPLRDKLPTAASADELDILNTGISLGQALPDLELQPSPQIKKQKAKKRKRKQFFDESLVLTNADMKKQLQDTSKLVCKRRKLPCSALDVWRFCGTVKNERVLHEPLLSGMCTNLQEVFERSFLPSRSESASLEASPGLMNAPDMEPAMPDMEIEPAMPDPEMEPAMPDAEMEPEQPRFGSHVDGILPDLMQSPSGREEFTPLHANNLGSVSGKGKTFETEVLPTFEILASGEPVGPELETPSVNLEEQLHLDDTNLGELPSLLNSADVEELNFLEASNASPGYGVIEVENMSARTRAVAQYLKEHSPAAQILENQSGSLSLNRILERKTRKQCARMFFETLVLKSYGLIDVQQEEAYGDILISPMPALSSIKF